MAMEIKQYTKLAILKLSVTRAGILSVLQAGLTVRQEQNANNRCYQYNLVQARKYMVRYQPDLISQ